MFIVRCKEQYRTGSGALSLTAVQHLQYAFFEDHDLLIRVPVRGMGRQARFDGCYVGFEVCERGGWSVRHFAPFPGFGGFRGQLGPFKYSAAQGRGALGRLRGNNQRTD